MNTKPIILAFLCFLAVFAGICTMQLRGALDGFDRWVGHADHRLPNIRQVPENCRWAVVERFIDLQPVETADAIIFGDSQMFSRGATQEQMFTTHWLGPDKTIINVSFLNGRFADMQAISQYLLSKNIKAPTLLLTISLPHYTHKNPIRHLPPRSWRDQSRALCAFKMRRIFTEGGLRTPRYRKLLTDFQKRPLPDDYLDFNADVFKSQVGNSLADFATLADRPIIIASPMAYDKLDVYDFNAAHIEGFTSTFKETCAQTPELTCLDFTHKISSEGLQDFVHFNARGHEIFADTLIKALQ